MHELTAKEMVAIEKMRKSQEGGDGPTGPDAFYPVNRWCEHLEASPKLYNKHLDPMALVFRGEYWQFCPICSTPRPKSKTLEEKVAEEIRAYQRRFTCPTPEDIAAVAIQAVREYDKESK